MLQIYVLAFLCLIIHLFKDSKIKKKVSIKYWVKCKHQRLKHCGKWPLFARNNNDEIWLPNNISLFCLMLIQQRMHSKQSARPATWFYRDSRFFWSLSKEKSRFFEIVHFTVGGFVPNLSRHDFWWHLHGLWIFAALEHRYILWKGAYCFRFTSKLFLTKIWKYSVMNFQLQMANK